MPLNIDGTPFYWPDGRPGTIKQEGLDRDRARNRQVFFMYLRADRSGERSIRGTLELAGTTLDDLPGADDSEKSREVSQALAEWIRNRGLTDGFSLVATVVNGRVEIDVAGN